MLVIFVVSRTILAETLRLPLGRRWFLYGCSPEGGGCIENRRIEGPAFRSWICSIMDLQNIKEKLPA